MSTTIYNDHELLRQIAQDDEKAFSQLLTKYYSLCFQIAMKTLRDKWKSEDIVQEVFLKIWLRRATLPEIDNFGAWLRTITANRLYNYLRKSKTAKDHVNKWWQELTLPERQGEETTEEEPYYEELISQALNLLSPRQKQVFTLIKQQGFTREKAAQMLSIGAESVKSHLEQAMRSIRAYCIGRLDNSLLWVIFSQLIQKYF